MMHSTKFCMIHIPRTGGTVLTNAFGHLPFVSKDVLQNKHLPASRMREIVGNEIWVNAFKFVIVRDPWDLVYSWYQLLQRSAEGLEDSTGATDSWLQEVQKNRATSLEQFVEWDVLSGAFVPQGGFIKKYANTPDINVLTSVGKAYEMLVMLTGFDPCLEIRPFSKAPEDSLAKVVREWCHEDVAYLA